MCLKSAQWTLAACKRGYRCIPQGSWDIQRTSRHVHLIVWVIPEDTAQTQKCQVVSYGTLVYAKKEGPSNEDCDQGRLPRRHTTRLELRLLASNLVPWVPL